MIDARFFVVWLLCFGFLSSCAGPEATREKSDAPPLIPRAGLATQPDPVPRWEPPALVGNRSPYMVFGKTYHVLPSAQGFVDEGRASWYGRKFHGRPTSNGERYDMFALTAAHRSLPLPTWVRVTNLDNGRSTIVRVNDRGPFHEERIIDLSYGTAVKLGFVEQGVAQVRIEAILPSRPGAKPAVASAANDSTDLADAKGRIWLQVGAFAERKSAQQLRTKLVELLGEEEGKRIQLDEALTKLIRVRIGPFTDLTGASRVQAFITYADISGTPLIVRGD